MSRIVVVGAGAAGTMAAIFAASVGADVVLLESTPDGGRKILISGGGRCNILPARLDESRFVTDSSAHTLRRIVRSWPLAGTGITVILRLELEADRQPKMQPQTRRTPPSSRSPPAASG